MRARIRRIANASFDPLIGLALCVGYLLFLLATSSDLAMSRDESFYVIAAENIARWLRAVWEQPGLLADPGLIDSHWEYNHEHPALMKTLFALSWLLQQSTGVFENDSAAFRFPGMLTASLLLWVIYLFGTHAFSRSVGLFSALAFALMPRVFYHSHLNCFDVPIVFFLTLSTYLYWKSLSNPWWSIGLGIAYGLSLATKHNAWILPGVLLIHWLWVQVENRKGASTRRFVPWWLLSMVSLGVPLFVLSWPWLWHDGFSRFAWYANFHTNHVHYPMAFLGHTYSQPPFPISFPWVMTLFTVPACVLVLALLAAGHRSRAWLPAFLHRRILPGSWQGPRADPRLTDVLWLGSLLAPLLVISLPSSPIFGGTKHWMPAYPFLALFAGLGFSSLSARAEERLKAWPIGGARGLGPILRCVLGSLLLAPGWIETSHSHPFGLSHYGAAAGHVAGAADLGMNRQFWGFTQGALAEWFAEALPDGGTVWPCDTTHFAWQMMQRDGMIPQNIRAAASMAQADYILVHHEDHFAEVDGQAWIVTGSVAPVHVLTFDGVPMVSVYKNR